ncbi:MAG TPA: LarC family nickel insertion protein [Actinomycetota bacterium]|jgi:uncharacterized protein (TIGR00299 family) protein|nr:LarC family nickel insertion protein [Actinomycetota bacterium]
MNLAYVDVVGGAAGDMLLAALLDAGADRDAVADAVSSVLHRRVECSTTEVNRRGLRALTLSVPEDVTATRRTPRALMDAVERATLDEVIRERAISVLARLFEAEARVHGGWLQSLELEELGTDDTLLDVVGIVAALDSLSIQRLAVSSIPMPPSSDVGGHGSPPPVTLELLSGFALHASAAGQELAETVTPTAAAIFSALGGSSPDMPTMVLGSTGVGAGARDPSSVPNVVRVLIGSVQEAPAAEAWSRMLLLETNVDDLSPELVPDAIDALLGAGALDAWTTPVIMKHGRPALTVSALCTREAAGDVQHVFFESTSTLGIRIHEVERPELERRTVEVDLDEGGPRIRVKISFLDGRAMNAKPEHADVVEAARKLGRSVRAVHSDATAVARRLLEESR